FRSADIFIIATPTPFKDDHQPDLSYVEAATKAIAPVLAEGNLVILESTSPVGTTKKVHAILANKRPDLIKFYVCHCPERVLPGRVLLELVENDRVIGGVDEASTQCAVAFYQEFVRGDLLTTDANTAEMAKLVENTSRDVNIAFANELSILCEKLGIDVWELIDLANRHPRVNILRPGPGVGGHCIAVDPWFIVSSNPEDSKLIQVARKINDDKPGWVIKKVQEKATRFKNPVIACLGLSYKPDIDDLRESPALSITKEIDSLQIGTVIVCEPNVQSVEGLELVALEEVLTRADIIIGLVAHKQFKKLPVARLSEKIVFDTCGIWR
ncbi:MAG: UDP-N-acetyl-D-mannosamine dehydrogenase, partial [Desulfobulbaceae bacterium]|nr:UDP-N-acetyl-D-mannosamine dehydrogenase [Desulfobulbaceae bacterium]